MSVIDFFDSYAHSYSTYLFSENRSEFKGRCLAVAAVAFFAIAAVVVLCTLPLEGKMALLAAGRFGLLAAASLGGIIILDIVTLAAKYLDPTLLQLNPLLEKVSLHFEQVRKGATALDVSIYITRMKTVFLNLLEKQSVADKRIKQHFMGRNLFGKGLKQVGWSLTMQGVALVASQLAKKYVLNNFFVCETLSVFEKKLQEVVNSSDNVRCSMIIPPGGHPKANSINMPFWQHKICVVVEKRNGQVHVAVLESSPKENGFKEFNTKAFDDENQQYYDSRFEHGAPPQFVIQRINSLVKQKIISSEQLHIYISEVDREFSYGCETFALKDAVQFHLSPNFFKELLTRDGFSLGNTERQKNYQGCRKIRYIEVLPPVFMKGTQSCSGLEDYLKKYPTLANQTFPYWKKGEQIGMRTLRQCMQANVFQKRNHYTTFQSYKYHANVLKLLEQHSGQDLLQMIAPVWVGGDLINL